MTADLPPLILVHHSPAVLVLILIAGSYIDQYLWRIHGRASSQKETKSGSIRMSGSGPASGKAARETFGGGVVWTRGFLGRKRWNLGLARRRVWASSTDEWSVVGGGTKEGMTFSVRQWREEQIPMLFRRLLSTLSSRCSSCSQPLPTPLPACNKCGSISPIPPSIPFHDLFALPYRPNPFLVDPVLLKRRFREAQAVCHPDSWASKGQVRVESILLSCFLR